MRLASALSRAVAISVLTLSPVPTLAQQPDPDRRSVRLAAGVVAQGGTFGDDAPRDAAGMFGPTFSAGIRRHPTHMVGHAFEAAFEPRPVTLGVQLADRVEVRTGLKVGERVVSAGVFLLDSESRLRATGGMSGHAHGGTPKPERAA